MRRFTMLLLTVALFGVTANASIIVNLVSVTGSGPFTYTYSAQLAEGEQLDATLNGMDGTFFTIYDIPGLLTVAPPTGWTDLVQAQGPTPPLTNPTDSATIPNVTFVYAGAPVADGPVTFNGFVITDTFGLTTQGQFAGEANKLDGTEDSNIGFTQVPSGVPEPTSMLLIGSGLLGLVFAMKKRSPR